LVTSFLQGLRGKGVETSAAAFYWLEFHVMQADDRFICSVGIPVMQADDHFLCSVGISRPRHCVIYHGFL
jgi:hypothetical protein